MICKLLGWFGAGQFSGELLPDLERESADYVCEAVSCSITLRNFRSAIGYCSWKYKWSCGALAVTKTRLLARRGFRTSLNTALDSPEFRELRISVEDQTTLLIAHDASVADPSWTGDIEHRFYNVEADYLLKCLRPWMEPANKAPAKPLLQHA